MFERVDREVSIGRLRWSIARLNDGSEATFARMKVLGAGFEQSPRLSFDKRVGWAAPRRVDPRRAEFRR